MAQRANVNFGTHAQSRQQDSEVEGTWQPRFESNDSAKEREYVAVMSVGFPGVVLWHVVCPTLGCALLEASHLTRLLPGIINRHFALLS